MMLPEDEALMKLAETPFAFPGRVEYYREQAAVAVPKLLRRIEAQSLALVGVRQVLATTYCAVPNVNVLIELINEALEADAQAAKEMSS